MSRSDLGHGHLLQHRIDTGSEIPVRHHPRRVSASERAENARQVDDMFKRGIISRSSSPCSPPVVLVRKKDGTIRFSVYYGRLNSVTKRDVYRLPRLDDALDRLHGASFFTTLDLLSGYWQVELHPNDAEKTAYLTPDGLSQLTACYLASPTLLRHFREKWTGFLNISSGRWHWFI